MAYVLRTTDNAGDVGRAADQNQSVNNDIFFNSQHLPAYQGWKPDMPPASPGAADEEFLTIGGMTEVDFDNTLTCTFADSGAKLVQATAVEGIAGLYKAIPAGSFSIWTKVGMSQKDLNTRTIGLGLWEDATDNSKKIGLWAIAQGISAYSISTYAYEYNDYNSPGASKIGSAGVAYGSYSLYLRMRRTGTNYYMDYSIDGWTWRSQNIDVAVTWSFTPTHFGIMVDNVNTGEDLVGYAAFFRYVASDVGLGGMMSGRRA